MNRPAFHAYLEDTKPEQLTSAVRILHDFVPELIRILMENPEEDWGEAIYLPVGGG